MHSKEQLGVLLASLFILSLSVLLFELTLTRLFSIILWYNYAFMAISIAFFGLGIGALVAHILKNKMNREQLLERVAGSSILFAVSLPIFLLVIGHLIPPSISFITIFFLASSIPFFLAGLSMALIYLAMSKQVSKLYFVDLAGASAATLILDPLIREVGAESLLLVLSVLGSLPALIVVSSFLVRKGKKNLAGAMTEKKLLLCGLAVLSVSTVLIVINLHTNILAIQPGENKGLHYLLTNSSIQKYLSTKWNSFSRIDVVGYHTNPSKAGSRELASILIDADAGTPILRWNGSTADLHWIKRYMDYMPYEISRKNASNTLVIGSGGGEDILVALAAGSKKVTAVELNPLIVSAVQQYGSKAGNLYNSQNHVQLYLDDGRRFISATTTKYDTIVIKLVDSWAAQLAGGYALSENYLYTVEAFKEYLHHLSGGDGKLVMIRWSSELPRLIPLAVEALRQYEKETGNQQQDISKQLLIVEDRPGLTFGPNKQHTVYPVLLVIKNSAFTTSELNFVKQKVASNGAKVIAIPGGYVQPIYLGVLGGNNINSVQQQHALEVRGSSDPNPSLFELKPPTDDSPFYFATEVIPSQMKFLIGTVLGVSLGLALLLFYYAKINRIKLTSSSRFHIVFAMLIGLGFIFLEITFIQKFLLLLGTPIMSLTVILFSILISTGIGAYLSGKFFSKNPYSAIKISIPPLVGMILIYYFVLQSIIDAGLSTQLLQRIALSVSLLSPAGFLMGFQFPSITKMASIAARFEPGLNRKDIEYKENDQSSNREDITLLWGVNIIASVIGTVLTATSSMVIGFGGNLLIACGLYLGALVSALMAGRLSRVALASQKRIIE
jgi:hypothetical protein